jgi:heterodisulfide reductase subunit A
MAPEDGVLYRRGSPSEILRKGDQVLIRAEDTLLGEPVEVAADLVVLAVGMLPQTGTAALAGMLKLSRSADGFFMEAHPKLRPIDTNMAGVFLAGCCQVPGYQRDGAGRAAAAAAMILMWLGDGGCSDFLYQEELCAAAGSAPACALAPSACTRCVG